MLNIERQNWIAPKRRHCPIELDLVLTPQSHESVKSLPGNVLLKKAAAKLSIHRQSVAELRPP